jgi:uncharacterized protein (TIGR03663 family)
MLPAAKTEERLTSPPWWPFWIAFAVAIALRLLWLDVRPLHHDEGVNGWFLHRLLQGYRWEYDPEKFHGPFLYFFSAPFQALLGMSEITLRLPVALASSAMIPLLLPLRRRLGRSGVTATAWLLAVSPSLVSYGRDLIHETFLVALTLALVAAAVRWLDVRRDLYLVLAVLSFSLLLTVKETAALTVGSLAAGAFAAWLAAGRGHPLWERVSWRLWALLALAFAVPYILLYTSFFTNPAGLVDSFRSYLPWTEKGFEGTGHEKPWPYFLKLLATFEPVALILGAKPLRRFLRRLVADAVRCLLGDSLQDSLAGLERRSAAGVVERVLRRRGMATSPSKCLESCSDRSRASDSRLDGVESGERLVPALRRRAPGPGVRPELP